ncbi:vhs domain-containing protein [Quercus suber]|uniref:Vhs domain-containing protein n=1 Tax=Quercus suber TaxID=58331 RepID=A0AAW0L2W0_QUESU
MDSSRRAVESYWRSRMIDGATSDEDKVTPVYKLEEICELLRSSHVSIVKEVSEFILKRLENKSPIVKQKALRLIKYAVGKSGVEFRREMQRHSAAVRPLFHYKGHPDPLKGDALNKAVRDTAHETIAAIFAGENDKPSPAEDLNKRIQGFGSTNYEMPSEEKKSFLSEVVGIGSASIKQGLSTFAQGHLSKKNENGSYKSPTTLRRSLTIESEHGDRYEPVDYRNETQGSFGISKNASSGSWSQDSRVAKTEITNGESGRSCRESKTREERLLETIVTSGGVRLQPTRDAIQVFLVEAAKLDALALSYALESKLQSPQWQVRMKAICVLESLLRKKDDEHFSTVESYFSENKDVVVRCSESPQASLKEKANKVLNLLGGEQAGSAATYTEKTKKADTTTVVPMPDLIDTGDPDAYQENFTNSQNDLFSGMTVDDKQSANENHMAEKKNGPELFDIFGSNHELPQEQETHKNDLNDLMGGLSINENTFNMKQKETSPVGFPQSLFSDSNSHPSHQVPNDALSGMFNSQTAMTNANVMFPPGAMPYNISPGLMMNPTFSSQPLNYAAMGNLLAQQQLLATMSNLQHLGNMNTQNAGVSHVGGTNGAYVPPLPDIFQSNFPTQQATSAMMNSSKKEETRAFDFISDHLNAARDPKRVV